MKIIITENEQEMATLATQHLLGQMLVSPNRVNLAITAGATPVEVYKQLAPQVKDKDYLDHVHYYNFDEIPYKKTQREGITMSDLRKLYFNDAAIPEERIHKLTVENYQECDRAIRDNGGLDCILLGIGTDGHFCGNLPNTTKFSDYTTLVNCDEEMKKQLAGMYDDPEEIPDSYVTMGPSSVLAAKQLVLIACGEHKAAIIKRLVEEDVQTEVPISILKTHPNLTIILDKAAASKLA